MCSWFCEWEFGFGSECIEECIDCSWCTMGLPCAGQCDDICEGDYECTDECMDVFCGAAGKRMTRGGGVWVFMANQSVLGGWNSTPMPVDFWKEWHHAPSGQ